jgi:hypothetical protein
MFTYMFMHVQTRFIRNTANSGRICTTFSNGGITDEDLRTTKIKLGFQEVFFRNYGEFSNLSAFENHAFIFVRT